MCYHTVFLIAHGVVVAAAITPLHILFTPPKFQFPTSVSLSIAPSSLFITPHTCRYNGAELSSLLWSLVSLDHRAPRAVAALGIGVTGRVRQLKVEELFHCAAALALLGYKPPDRLEGTPRQDGGECQTFQFDGS